MVVIRSSATSMRILNYQNTNKMKKKYKTLEQQIVELWQSRGIKVIKETFMVLKSGKLRWIITAEKRDSESKSR